MFMQQTNESDWNWNEHIVKYYSLVNEYYKIKYEESLCIIHISVKPGRYEKKNKDRTDNGKRI